ncbi:MAG: head-tail connector protein [Deltaproteobacteria bacterium]
MMLIELTTVPNIALPVTDFREHLRLGSGFADDGLQNSVLESFLKAAISAIEGRTGKALLQRQFLWSISAWRDGAVQVLPIAPVVSLISLKVLDRTGAETVVPVDQYRLVKDGQRPKLVATSLVLPTIPFAGSAEMTFEAGFGATWDDLPADLGQAVMLLAAHYYDNRNAVSENGAIGIPFGVGALIERYRSLSVTLGGGR